MYKLSLVFLFINVVCALEKINTELVNSNVERSIDLSSQLVKVTATITLKNTGKESARSYLIAVEPGTVGNLSYVSVKDALKEDLRLSLVQVEGHKDKIFYSVLLKQPLVSARTVILTLEYVLTNALVPYPSTILQKDKQLVHYFGSHYFYTPYKTSKQTTIITLASRTVENYSKLKPVTQTDSTLTYGPYSDVSGLNLDTLMVHFESSAPFLTVTHLERLIEVSHWGNIAVEENIEILHSGAKLKGPFSRYDYQRDTSNNHHSIKLYRTVLPASANSIYYRDSNGNISTSQVRSRKEWTELELRPRFPLFGGWRSSYTLGYNVPSYQYLYKNPLGRYVLKIRLLDHVFDDMNIQELEVAIVLPVGVRDIKITPPYDVKRLEDDVTHKYLDHLGRIVIKLKKNNLVEYHIQDLEISYEWQHVLLLHEPAMLALALYLLFIVVIIYVRLDFSINKPEHSKKE